jgi:hypothetical protein
MDTNYVKQNLKNGSGDGDDDDDEDDDDDVQQIELKITKEESIMRATLRQKGAQFKSECEKSSSQHPARKQGSQEASADHPWIKKEESIRATLIRQKRDQFKSEYEKSSSQHRARKQGSQEARADHPWMILSLIGLIAAILVIYVFNSCGGWVNPGKVLPPSNVAVTKSEREKNLRIGIQQVHDEFPSQLSTTWEVFSSGIKEVQETPTKPSLFLLLHEAEEWTPACLAWKIGNISAHFLNARYPYPVVLDGANIENNQTLVEDYGILLEEYSPMVEERCTMIVKNLHKIPGIVAQSFHWFCDTVTPLVDKAVYLFTMKIPGVGHAKDSPYTLAENELRRLWNAQLDEDKLTPLIARITDTVMIIKPEKNHISCPDGTIVPEREHI